MATRAATFVRLGDDTIRVTWSGLTNGDDGAPINETYAEYSDRSGQAFGTFGAGGNLKAEGSNDGGTTYATLNDPSSAALDYTAAKIEQIMEISGMFRPRVSAGDGTTNLTFVLVMRKVKYPR